MTSSNNGGFIPDHGGFKELKAYQKAVVVYDATVAFCARFHRRNRRRTDQMEQAARSGKQNIVEGSLASATSKQTEVHLTNVAKASLGELLEDYQDFLRTKCLPIWDKTHPEAERITARARAGAEETYDDYRDAVEQGTPELAANTVRHLTLQAIYLLARQIKQLEANFLQQGGIRERMTAARLRARDASSSSQSSASSMSSTSSESSAPSSPSCPDCGAPMARRTARRGANAGNPFWGCSKYPDCTGTRPVAGDGEDKEDSGKPLLIGNSFPLGLIRRPVRIRPVPMAEFRAIARGRRIFSFWGHANTLAAAEAVLGFSPAPTTERPVLTLSPSYLPMLAGRAFDDCWVLSPDYVESFRPAIGEEVPIEKIKSWQILNLKWEKL